jgi:DNA-3-methyladenine glycosylase
MYDCLNVVTGPDGLGGAVLVRAAAPLEGIGVMRADRAAHAGRRRRSVDRGVEAGRVEALPVARLASGPGLLAAAFGIERSDTGADLCDEGARLRLEPPSPGDRPPPRSIRAGPRIGIAYASEPWRGLPWRLWVADDPSVSDAGRARRVSR